MKLTVKGKITAKTILLYVTYTALSVVSGGVFEGNVAFGLFVGAVYSANPIIAAVVYLASAVIYGWTSLMHAAVKCAFILLFVGIHYFAKRKINKLTLLVYLVIANVFYVVYSFIDYFNLFDRFLYAGLGIAFAYVCIYVFRAVFVRGLNYRPALDETICIGLLTAVAGYCISRITFGQLQLVYFIAPFAILFCVVCFGDKTALMGAVLIGIGNVFATGSYECCVYCVISALASVTLCKVNRYVGALSVLVVDVLMSYFLNLHGAFNMAVFAPTFASALVFVVIPTKVYHHVRDYCSGSAERYLSKSVVQKVGDTVSRRLYRLSDIFMSMKQAFFTMSQGAVTPEDAEKGIVKQCSENVCRDCQSRVKCWRQDIAQTEESLLQLGECAVKRGKCTILDVPQALSVKCDRVSAVISEVNAQAQNYRAYRERAETADNGKTLLGEQMGGVSNLLMQLATDVKNRTGYDHAREKELVESLVFHNVLCSGAVIAQQKEIVTVVLTVAKSDIDNETIEKVVSGVVKQNMVVERIETTESATWVNVFLNVRPRYNVTFGVSSVAKHGNEISGDTHTVTRTDNGKCIVALCDGMGSGDKAEQMSATSISLVESFYRAGFDNDTILSCVNKLLVGSGNEVFCAVDVVVLDLYNGLADFIKLGACAGLVKNDGKVEIVSGSSLPLGVLEEMKPSITKKALMGGDVVVLYSDGVADCFKDPVALARVFADVSLNVPQSIADVILTRALKLCNNKPNDDMTVVVAKIA
ncbi:MAG: SpoIIE family protein phosphatase [Clostridiales bacterium]|nr:SpoIIE family protein phosphatase [Clostridiales bacterium]